MVNYNTIAEFEAALKRAKDGLNNAVEVAVRNNVKSLVANIRMRVSGTGTNAAGQQFSAYSKKHEYKRKKNGSGSLGKQTEYKGFFYKGIMWANFKMLSLESSTNKVNATLGFEGANAYTSNDKLNEYHSERENIKIAAPNADEAKNLVRKIGFEIGEYLKSAL